MPKIGSTQISRTVRRKIAKKNKLQFPLRQLGLSNTTHILESTISGDFNNSELNNNSAAKNYHVFSSTSSAQPEVINSTLPSPTKENSDLQLPKKDFKDEIRSWAIKHNLSGTATSSLLKLLRQHTCFKDLPQDYRTLLCTPRVNNIFDLEPGQYCHFPLHQTLCQVLSNYPVPETHQAIQLQFNIDGLPISNSSSQQFWPILCHVTNVPESPPFALGIYYGLDKPKSSQELLQRVVNDLNNCRVVYISSRQIYLPVNVHSFVCDAPARSFILNIKGHAGYFGCHKCTVEGEYIQHRMTFPDVNCQIRTDDSFRRKINDEHHLCDDTELLKLPIDVVKTVPLDYQHLVCLGVVRKLINLWIRGSVKIFRLPSRSVHQLSRNLISIKYYFSSEFARKPRSLQHLKNWKATELRSFLLYSGPVVLKSILPDVYYNHFLCLHVAISILCSKLHQPKYIKYAEQLLIYFVKSFGTLYGTQSISYNVHSLIHLAADSANFGVLDNFSTFKFENYLGKIKRQLRSGNKPLEQIYNRISEIQSINSALIDGKVKPLVNNFKVKEFVISPRKGDNCCLLTDDTAFVVETIFERLDGFYLSGRKLENSSSFYVNPCTSDLIGIKKYTSKSSICCIHSSVITSKALLLPDGENYIIIPLLHSTKYT